MIRPATRTDLPRILEIRNNPGEHPLSDPSALDGADAARFLDAGALQVWEEPGGRVSGFVVTDTADGSLRVLLVAVGDEGKGIGRALLKAGCDMLSAAGHRSATLRTRPGSPTEEHYRRDGWTGNGIDEAGRLILRKPLSAK
jgi:GNAT superfamily N-acetyltransferase